MVLAVLFRVSDIAYAIPCQSVLEVFPLRALRAPSHAPAWMAGTFAYRGVLVPVIDACRLLGGYPCTKRLSSRMALVRSSTQERGVIIAGVIAERMTEVRRLSGQTLLTPTDAPHSYLGNVIKEATELVQLIEVDSLVGITLSSAGSADVDQD
jgi:chemotaxis-related protein WspB